MYIEIEIKFTKKINYAEMMSGYIEYHGQQLCTVTGNIWRVECGRRM
jgi:hypothetical protein